MSLFLPLRRATLLIPSGPAHDVDRKHLFILLTDPVVNPDDGKQSVILTSLSSLDPALPHDPTCILSPGDHPFVTRASFVNYRYSRIMEGQKILNGVKSGLFVPMDPMDANVFARICKGLSDSRNTVPKIMRFFEICNATPG
jgi:hypothetical protein